MTDDERPAGPTFKQLNAAIIRTREDLARTHGDEYNYLYAHLAALLDAEEAYFAMLAHPSVRKKRPTEEAEAEAKAEEEAPEPEEEDDEAKIAARIAAGDVTVVPSRQKKERKPSNRSPHSRWEQGERLRKILAAKKGVPFVPIRFEDSKFGTPTAGPSEDNVIDTAQATSSHDLAVPEPLEGEDGERIQIGGIELRP